MSLDFKRDSKGTNEIFKPIGQTKLKMPWQKSKRNIKRNTTVKEITI